VIIMIITLADYHDYLDNQVILTILMAQQAGQGR
jgi:hypothetical protein